MVGGTKGSREKSPEREERKKGIEMNEYRNESKRRGEYGVTPTRPIRNILFTQPATLNTPG